MMGIEKVRNERDITASTTFAWKLSPDGLSYEGDLPGNYRAHYIPGGNEFLGAFALTYQGKPKPVARLKTELLPVGFLKPKLKYTECERNIDEMRGFLLYFESREGLPVRLWKNHDALLEELVKETSRTIQGFELASSPNLQAA